MKGRKIRQMRKELGMTQVELASEIGVTPMAVSHWESGFRKPSLLAIRAIQMLKQLHQGDTFKEMLQREANAAFDRINQQSFNAELSRGYEVTFTRRMKTTEGTALPEKKKIFLSMTELGKSGWSETEETLKHEMVHCWLYEKGRPWGHNREFKAKLNAITKPYPK